VCCTFTPTGVLHLYTHRCVAPLHPPVCCTFTPTGVLHLYTGVLHLYTHRCVAPLHQCVAPLRHRLFKSADSVALSCLCAESSKDVCFHYTAVRRWPYQRWYWLQYRQYRWYQPIPNTKYWYQSKPVLLLAHWPEHLQLLGY